MRPVPSQPKAILRAVRPYRTNLLLQKFDGATVTLKEISRDCGGMPDHYCEIELPTSHNGISILQTDRIQSVGSDWLEFTDQSLVPETHTKHPMAAQAWLSCHYSDEAWAKENAERNKYHQAADDNYVERLFPKR